MRIGAAVVVRMIVLAWVPVVALLSVSLVWGDYQAPAYEPSGIHLSVGVLAVLAGIVGFIGPGFWWLGKQDQRLMSHDARISLLEGEARSLVHQSVMSSDRVVESSDRIASAIERLAERGER